MDVTVAFAVFTVLVFMAAATCGITWWLLLIDRHWRTWVRMLRRWWWRTVKKHDARNKQIDTAVREGRWK